jgi:hypothetical protein
MQEEAKFEVTQELAENLAEYGYRGLAVHAGLAGLFLFGAYNAMLPLFMLDLSRYRSKSFKLGPKSLPIRKTLCGASSLALYTLLRPSRLGFTVLVCRSLME